MKRRLLSMLLALSMVAGMIPAMTVSVAAADDSSTNELPIDATTYSSLGLSVDTDLQPEANYPYSTQALTPMYVASEVYLATNGSSGNKYTVRDGLDRMHGTQSYSDAVFLGNSANNYTGGLAYYGATTSDIKSSNGYTVGSRLSSNTDNSLKVASNSFSGIYATSVAFNAGEGQDNYIAELRAYGTTSGSSNRKVTIAIFEIAADGTRTLVDEEELKGGTDNYFARRYASELEGVFEIEVADVNGDGVDELFVYGCDYYDADLDGDGTTNRYACVEQWKFASNSLSYGETHYIDGGYYNDFTRNGAESGGNGTMSSSWWYDYFDMPILTMAAGDLNGDFKEEIAFTLSVPNGHDSTNEVGHTYIYQHSGSGTTLEQIQLDSVHAVTSSVSQTGAVQLYRGVSQNCTIGTFDLPDGSGTVNALLIAGYKDGSDNYAWPGYGDMTYRFVYYDYASGEYVVSDAVTTALGTAGSTIIDSTNIYGSSDAANNANSSGKWEAIPAPIPLATAQMDMVGTADNNDDEVMMGGDVYAFSLSSGLGSLKLSPSLYDDQVNENNNNKSKNLIWIGEIETGIVNSDPDNFGWSESFLYVVGLHRDQPVNDDDDYYWMDLGAVYTNTSGNYYTTQEGVIADSNSRNDQYGTFVSLALPDIDDDSVYMRYMDSYAVYTNPEVYAVLQAAPYFSDLSETYDYPGNGATAYGKTTGISVGGGVNFTQSVGVYTAAEVQLGGGAEASRELSVGVSMSYNYTKSFEYSTTFNNAGDSNMVVLYTIPYTYYTYEVYSPDTDTWGVVSFPAANTPITTMISVEQYDEIASKTAGLDVIEGSLLYNTPGEPDTYYNPSMAGTSQYASSGYMGAVATSGSDITQEIAVSDEHSVETEIFAEVNAQVGAGVALAGNKVTAGMVSSTSAGASAMFSYSTGTTFAGTVDNLPSEATNYSFSWKLLVNEGELNGNPVWMVGYDVVDVIQPPRMPQNLSVEYVTSDSVTLIWEGSSNVSNYEIYLVDESTGGYNLIATVPYTSTTYTDYNVEPSTTYQYTVRAVSSMGSSIYSPIVTATTFSNLASFEINGQPADDTTYAGGTATYTVNATYLNYFGVSQAVSYEWQQYEDGEWVVLTNLDNEVSGYNTKTLTVTSVTSEMDGSIYRCRVYYSNRSLYSATASLEVSKESSSISMAAVADVVSASGTYDAVVGEETILSYTNASLTVDDTYYALMSDGTGLYWYDGTNYYAYTGSDTVAVTEDGVYSYLTDDAVLENTIGDPYTVVSSDPTVNVVLKDDYIDATIDSATVTFAGTGTAVTGKAPTVEIDGLTYTGENYWTTPTGNGDDYYTLYEMTNTTSQQVEYEDEETGELVTDTASVTLYVYYYTETTWVEDTSAVDTESDDTEPVYVEVTSELIYAGDTAYRAYTETYTEVNFTGTGVAYSGDAITATDDNDTEDDTSDDIVYTATTAWTKIVDGTTFTLYYMIGDEDATAYYYAIEGSETLTPCSTNFVKYVTDGVKTDDLSQVSLQTTTIKDVTVAVDADTEYVTFSATVDVGQNTAEYSSGAVTFYITGAITTSVGATYDASTGTYTAQWQPNAEGSYSVYAVYSGNDYYFGSSSSSKAFHAVMSFEDVEDQYTIDHAALVLDTSSSSVSYGNSATFSVLAIANDGTTSSVTDVTKEVDYKVLKLVGSSYETAVEGTDYMVVNGAFSPMVITTYTVTATWTDADGTVESNAVIISTSKGSLTITAVDVSDLASKTDPSLTPRTTPTEIVVSGAAPWDTIDLEYNADYGLSTSALDTTTVSFLLSIFVYSKRIESEWNISVSLKDTDTITDLASKYNTILVPGTYYLTAESYDISVSSGTNGSVSTTYQSDDESLPIDLGNLSTLPEGYSVTVTAVPEAGYVVAGWKVNGEYVLDGTNYYTLGTYTIDSMDKDYDIQVEYEQGENSLKFSGISEDSVGSGTVKGYYLSDTGLGSQIGADSTVNYNHSVRLVAIPDEGSAIDHWTVQYGTGAETTLYAANGTDLYTADTYDLSNFNSDVTVKVYFVQEEIIQVTINPVDGDGAEMVNAMVIVGSEMLTERVVIVEDDETTDEDETVTAYVYEGGTGDNITIQITPPSGLLIDSWTVGEGQTTGSLSNSKTTMTMYNLKSDTDFTVTISGMNEYGVWYDGAMDDDTAYDAAVAGTISAVKIGSGSVSYGESLTQGSTILFTAEAEKGYEIIGWTLNGEEVAGTYVDEWTQTYQVSNLDAAGAAAVAVFRKKPVLMVADYVSDGAAISVVATQDGETVTLDLDSTACYVDYDSTITVTATPPAGEVITAICGTEVNPDQDHGDMSLEIANITTDKNITASWGNKPSVILKTLSSGIDSASITGVVEAVAHADAVAAGYVDYGTAVSIQATPEDGYVVYQILVDGTAVYSGTENGAVSCTVDTVVTGITVEIVEKAKPTVAFVAPANGDVAVSGIADDTQVELTTGDYVDFGTSLIITATPDDTHIIGLVMADGVTVLDNSEAKENGAQSCDVTDVAVDVAIAVLTEKKPLVTYSAAITGGVVEAAGIQMDSQEDLTTGEYVDFYSTLSITATPDDDYIISKILVNDITVLDNSEAKENGAQSCDVANIATDASITVITEEKPIVTYSAVANGTIVSVTGIQMDSQETLTTGDYVDFYTDVTVEVEPDSGYVVTAISANGTTIATNPNRENGNLVGTLENVTVDSAITVTISSEDGSTDDATEEKPYVTVTKASNVTIIASSTQDGAELTIEENGSGYVDFYLSNAAMNNDVTIDATPEDGYVVTAIYVNGAMVASNSGKANGELTYTIADISADATITVEVVEKADVAVANTENGDITATFVSDDREISITEGGSASYAVDYIDFNESITVALAPDYKYEVAEDSTIAYTAVANSDDKIYTIADVDVDSFIQFISAEFVAIPTMSLTFSVKDKDGADDSGVDGTLTAIVERKSMSDYAEVETTNADGDEEKLTVYRDSTITFITTPDEGYYAYKWIVNGVEQATTTAPTFTITGENLDDIDVQVQFIQVGDSILYSVSDATGETTITAIKDDEEFMNDGVVLVDTVITFIVDEDSIPEGYHLGSWTVDGVVVEDETDTTYEYQAAAGAGAVVVAIIVRDSYEVTFEAENGTISAISGGGTTLATGDQVVGDTTVTFTATPDAGFGFWSWVVDGRTSDETGNLTLTITEDTQVSAEFELLSVTYDVTFGATDENGAVSASDGIESGDAVDSHADITFTAEPAEGYQVAAWYLDDILLGDSAELLTYTVTDLLADTDVKVVFEAIPTYTIAVAVTENGTISATVNGEAVEIVGGAFEAKRHDEVVVIVTPDSNIYLAEWTVDGALNANSGYTYTIDDLLNDATVEVNLLSTGMSKFNATVVNGNGGLIAQTGYTEDEMTEIFPEYDVYVTHGMSVVLTATPDAGYMVKAWTVNGEVMDNLSNTLTIDYFQGVTIVTVEYETTILHSIPTSVENSYTISDLIKTPADYGTDAQVRDRGDVTFTLTLAGSDDAYVSRLIVGGVNLVTTASEDITSCDVADAMSYTKEGHTYTITLEGVNADVIADVMVMDFMITYGDLLETYSVTITDEDGNQEDITVTAEELEALFEELAEDEIGNPSAMITREVKLMVSTDGVNWTPAIAEQFPVEGVTIVLDLPSDLENKSVSQLSASTYEFAVVHYVISDINGAIAGTTELYTLDNGLTLVEQENGIVALEMTAYSLSPFAIAYQYTSKNGGSGSSGVGSSSSSSTTTEDVSLVHDAYIYGYPDGTFHPQGALTRAEALTFFANLMDPAMDSSKTYVSFFTDVTTSLWYANVVGFMSEYNIISGYADGTFGGDDTITRAEFAVMATRFAGLDILSDTESFADVSDHWAADYIATVVDAGWICGYDDETFKPDQTITRAEAVTIINRMLGRVADEDYIDSNADEANPFSDLADDHWAYYQIIEAAVTHGYELDGETEQWTEVSH